MEVIAVLYMQDWHICVPADFSLGFEGDMASEQHQIVKQAWRLAGDDTRAGSKILAH